MLGRVPQSQAAADRAPIVADPNSGRQRLELLRLPSAKHDVVALRADYVVLQLG